ncbi:trypsin-like peptidase domain-containing protein [Hyphomonas sp.]|uniref:trypsin-like peptidase domain-containing protein n=1 Tax=Hyphomonas sp. TaxID=87 RepID=UPI00391CC6C6
MAKAKRGETPEAGLEGTGGAIDWKSLLTPAPVLPHVVELLPPQGSPVVPRRIDAHSDVYLAISVLSFYHPEARKGLTKQIPLIFADATWRRPTDMDLPQTAVMGPNPDAHPNMAKHGNYAFGGRTFFGPARFDGAVNVSIGMHLFKSNEAARKLIDVARAGSKLMPKGEMLVLGSLAGAGIDGALKGLKELLPDKQTPWVVGRILELATSETEGFQTGTWATVAGGGPRPEGLYLDRHDNLLRDGKGKPLQKPYIVYSVEATETNPDRLRVGNIPHARARLSDAHRRGERVSEEQLRRLFEHFCDEVEMSDDLTQRDRDEIIADAAKRFERMMAKRKAFSFEPDESILPAKAASPVAVSAFRAPMPEEESAGDATKAIETSLESLKAALKDPDAEPDEGTRGLLEQLYTAVSDYAALVRSNPERYRPVIKDVAKKIRDQREFKALLQLATAVREGGAEIGWLNYYGAAADIELNGAPSLEDLARAESAGEPLPAMAGEAFLAKAIELAGRDFENDPALLSDCLGLQGRIWKTRAVRAREVNEATRLAFERSYTYYSQGVAVGADPQFHQVNLLGLVHAAEKRGIALGKKGEAAKWARDILKQIKKTPDTKNPYAFANAGDAALFLGREGDAAKHYQEYMKRISGNPFAVNATRRQLIEVWGINPKGNTELANIVRLMGHLAMRSMATVSVTVEEIEALAESVEPEGKTLEAVLGGLPAIPAKEIREVLNLAQSVGKVCAPSGRAVGTGFLLHGRHVHASVADEYVFVTNDHVVCDVKDHGGIAIRSREACIFFEDLDPDTVYQVSEVFWRSDVPMHDCAILRLHQQPPKLAMEIEPADNLLPRVHTEAGKAESGGGGRASRVYVIGHPNGRGLEITFEQNFIIDHEQRNPAAKVTPSPVRIHYYAPTEPGNSGSPVLSAFSRKLIGLHHSTTDKPLGREKKPNEAYRANEGLWIQAILAAVREEKGAAPVAAGGGGAAVSAPQPAPQPQPQPVPQAAPKPQLVPPPQPAPKPVAQAAPIATPPIAPELAGAPRPVLQLETAQTASDYLEGLREADGLESGANAVTAFMQLSPKPVAKWPVLADHPDTKHLAHLKVDLNKGMSFDLTGAALRKALAMASTPVNPKWGRKVLFGIRGALPKAGAGEDLSASFFPAVPMREIEPNHVDYHCTLGVWDTQTDEVFVCHGSTVPAVGYLWNSVNGRSGEAIGKGSNMLAPGVYLHKVGTHADMSSSRQPGAFRQAAKMCVMRLAGEQLSFRQGNVRWDTSSDAGEISIWDNIHAGLGAPPEWGAKHFSAGCQVVRGSVMTRDSRDRPTGHWRAFREAAGLAPDPVVTAAAAAGRPFPAVSTPEDGAGFAYVLLTAREVRIAAENMDAPATDLQFLKLRRGSQGETVKALQQALGVTEDGDFGFLTQRALILKQLELTGEADGVVTAANAAEFGLA